VYGIPAFAMLEARGREVLVVHARHVTNVPGRKTDVHEAVWLPPFHQHGLLRGSVRPAPPWATLRASLRHRERGRE
jgi:hypothetical protein